MIRRDARCLAARRTAECQTSSAMGRGGCAALLGLLIVGVAASPIADASSNDERATSAYLHAYGAFLDETRLAVPAAQAEANGFVNQVVTGCPKVLAHAPRNSRFGEVLSEAFLGLAIAFIRPLETGASNFAGKIEHLRWSNRRLTRLVTLAAAQARATTKISAPQLCSDLIAWVAAGYRNVARTTTSFLDMARPLSEEQTVHGRPIEEEIHRLLVPSESPAARSRARSLERVRVRLEQLLGRAVMGPLTGLRNALGVVPQRTSRSPATPFIAPPAAVVRADGQRLSEFTLGRAVAAQSGCLACHRIGEDGNSGPGRDLTYVGSRLSAREIERALINPKAPMPSFKNLPKAKLKALVRFLSLLRR